MSSRDLLPTIRVRHLGEVDYLDAWQKVMALYQQCKDDLKKGNIS